MIESELPSGVSLAYVPPGPGRPTVSTRGDAMSDHTDVSADVLGALRVELLRLADREDDRAAAEASKVPYWTTCPPSVSGHRAAATILRQDAASLGDVA